MGSSEILSKKNFVMTVGIIVLLIVLAFLWRQLVSSPSSTEFFSSPGILSQDASMPAMNAVVPLTGSPSAPTLAPGTYVIQVAAFQDKAKAEKVAEGLRQKGHVPVVAEKDLGEKGTWQRVYTGEFGTLDDTKALLETLRKDYPEAFVRKL